VHPLSTLNYFAGPPAKAGKPALTKKVVFTGYFLTFWEVVWEEKKCKIASHGQLIF